MIVTFHRSGHGLFGVLNVFNTIKNMIVTISKSEQTVADVEAFLIAVARQVFASFVGSLSRLPLHESNTDVKQIRHTVNIDVLFKMEIFMTESIHTKVLMSVHNFRQNNDILITTISTIYLY